MNIVHVGGYPGATIPAAKCQAERGWQATVIGVDDCPAFNPKNALLQFLARGEELFEQDIEIIHFHSCSDLNENSLPQKELVLLNRLLDAFREKGARVVWSVYHLPARNGSLSSPESCLKFFETLSQNIDLYLLSDPNCAECIPERSPVKWQALGVSVPTDHSKICETRLNEVRILLCEEEQTPISTDALGVLCQDLSSAERRCTVTSLKIDQELNLPELDAAIEDCDILIESLDTEAPGIVAIEGLARGKTVLSGNKSELSSRYPQLGMCPVLDTSSKNLRKRIESLLKEPRSIRDLSKRSRKYAETYHRAGLVSAQYGKLYEDLLALR